ncbi:SIMPL domain-containing protein [Bordetella bronchialis]|uniref:SIMPL domain-containing protein n=1 Tax=Bordetella bronchialis TaxID=463025 RepID=UPI003CFCDEA0
MPGRTLDSLGRLWARSALILCAACAAPAAVLAQPAESNTAAAGQSADDKRDTGPLLTLQAAASEEVRQDTVQITVSTQVDAPDQAAVGKKLNVLLDELMKTAKSNPDVAARTGSYRVWPNNNNKGKLVSWQGEGSIILESANFEAASALATRMGDKSAISNINFTLSRKAREAVERKLLNQAAQAFRERALAAASAFGFNGYRLKEIHLGGVGAVAPRAYMAMAKGAPAPAADVPLQADMVTVSVDINGTIVLQ